jgi:serine/threonine protein kinase
MASDAAKGMVYLHTRSPPVYHRDLKSANLLVTSQWQVKVADFNLSRALEPTDIMSSLCIQNPRWLAPEVLAGEEGGLPADVWAFGTVLWELMTWRAPFEGMNPYQVRPRRPPTPCLAWCRFARPSLLLRIRSCGGLVNNALTHA